MSGPRRPFPAKTGTPGRTPGEGGGLLWLFARVRPSHPRCTPCARARALCDKPSRTRLGTTVPVNRVAVCRNQKTWTSGSSATMKSRYDGGCIHKRVVQGDRQLRAAPQRQVVRDLGVRPLLVEADHFVRTAADVAFAKYVVVASYARWCYGTAQCGRLLLEGEGSFLPCRTPRRRRGATQHGSNSLETSCCRLLRVGPTRVRVPS